ncbi:oligopeptide transport system substrate-binding protein [Crossiella equi]|uniref:Oligopeptide transport system substrate-binding protein n=1 Tax=Crossiella equi TaxID=130796 RepID=A0ABS5ALF2_9PSEU|nr:ABC transporter substrate-binding protein [Crossiella equi]MBP2477404.1 oligopeptide transport system substrate-binding protein [Crossiella equi]
MRPRNTLRTALVTCAALVLAACSGPGAEPAPKAGQLRLAVVEPATLLPGQAQDQAGRLLAGALWTPLLTVDTPRQAPEPAAAERVDSPDQRRWTIRLRPGWRFHDGSPVTARAYAETWRAARAQGWAAAAVLDQAGVREVRTPEELTLEVELAAPLAHFPVVLTSLALAPLPELVVARGDWGSLVGNGPYRAERPWAKGAGTRLVAFDGYSGARRARSAVEVRVVAAEAQYEALTSGRVDLATEITAAEHGELGTRFASSSSAWPQLSGSYLAFPLWRAEFADSARRHAVSMAIDREALATGPLGHRVSPMTGLLPTAVGTGRTDSSCRPCNHDVQAAALLARQGELPKAFPVWFEQADAAWAEKLVEQLRVALNAPGITAKAVSAERLREAVATRSVDGPWVASVRGGYPHPLAVLGDVAAGTGFEHADFRALVAAAGVAADPWQDLRLAENVVLRELPVAPLWSPHGHLYWSARVSEVRPDPVAGLRLAEVRAG